VRAWVSALPERQRLAVFLRYFADLDYRGIATALGIEVGTVSATLSAAHTALRRSFEEVQHS
jgi:RNA polymerase sigma factor (sigma-70 family)